MPQATPGGGLVPDESENVASWEVDGVRYDVDLFDIDGLEWRDITSVTRLLQSQVMGQALLANEFEPVAALLWIVRRRVDKKVKYEQVLKSLTYRSLRRINAEEEGEAAPPD